MTNLVIEINDTIAREVNRAILAKVAEKPESKLFNLEDLDVRVIKDFLRSKHCGTWSIYSISSEDTLDKAARWFSTEIFKLYEFMYGVRQEL